MADPGLGDREELERRVARLEAELAAAGGGSAARWGREYKSATTVWGVPLLHVANGFDATTGRPLVAKATAGRQGIIAIGNVAVGVVALGGAAFGGIAVGGFSLGVVAIGGVAIGLGLALGGLAVGLVAVGGMAVGAVAFGGGVLGWWGLGGGGFTAHPLSDLASNPACPDFLREILRQLPEGPHG